MTAKFLTWSATDASTYGHRQTNVTRSPVTRKETANLHNVRTNLIHLHARLVIVVAKSHNNNASLLLPHDHA